jgi:hypothetical protein
MLLPSLLAPCPDAPRWRTVASALRATGLEQDWRLERYHRVLSRARWFGLAVGRTLLVMLVAAFVLSGPLVVGVDETVERRRGAKIAAKGSTATPCALGAATSSRRAGRAGSA